MQAKNNNVIRFPDRKIEPTAPVQVPKVNPSEPPQKRSEQKRKLGLGLVFVVAASFLANRMMTSWTMNSGAEGGRSLASVSENMISEDDRKPDWEKNLASQLQNRGPRELASLTMGRAPSDEDRLRFDTLKSQYAIIMENGKLSEIRAASGEGQVYVRNAEDFINENRNLMPVSFASVVGEQRTTTESGIEQNFELLNEERQPVGKASFGLDRYGRLIKFSVSSASTQ